MLGNARYRMALDASLLHAAAHDQALLLDEDGSVDGIHNVTFHRLRGDFDGNRTVTNADRDILFTYLGKRAGTAGYNYAFDLDANGMINMSDYLVRTKLLGHTVGPPPS